MKSKIVIPTLILGSAGAILLSTSKISAQQDLSLNGSETLVQRLASKFNLNNDEVQATVDEYRAERQAERQAQIQAHFESKLQELIDEGSLTQDQANLLRQRQEQMRAEREAEKDAWQNMSPEEKQAAKQEHRNEMQSKRAECETWAQDNGIDPAVMKELHPAPQRASRMGKGIKGNGLGMRMQSS